MQQKALGHELLDLQKPLPSKKQMLTALESLKAKLEGVKHNGSADDGQAKVSKALKVGSNANVSDIAEAYNVLLTERKSRGNAHGVSPDGTIYSFIRHLNTKCLIKVNILTSSLWWTITTNYVFFCMPDISSPAGGQPPNDDMLHTGAGEWRIILHFERVTVTLGLTEVIVESCKSCS